MVNCNELAEQYHEALTKAQECSPEIDTPQCTEGVEDALFCGCPTWANPENEEALDELERIAKEGASCAAIVLCPAILCIAPGSGVCTSSGGDGGRCVNAGVVEK
jgi:hypothetical protein